MKDYKDYSLEDFAKDDFFQSWVFCPDDRNTGFWSVWISENPDKKAVIDDAKRMLKQVRFDQFVMSDADITRLWSKIQQSPIVDSKKVKARSAAGFWLKVAASFLLVSASFVGYYYFSSPLYVTYHTAFGESKTILLPDSSTVVLNSNSVLKFINNRDEMPVREVWLEGEAFFSVTHTKNDLPFMVRTAEGLSVKVLGTTFNFFHRINETKVILNSGKIQLQLPEDQSKNIEMKPGDFVEYKDKSLSTKRVNPEVYSAWTENKLVLDHTSLRDMIEMLHNNYGVVVKVREESLLNQTASGSMPINDVDSLVNQIAQIFQLNVEKQNNSYVMYQE